MTKNITPFVKFKDIKNKPEEKINELVEPRDNEYDVTLTFTQTAMNVDDANANPVGYTRWETTIPGIGYSDIVTYRITIT